MSTVDRIRASWLGSEVERYATWLAEEGYAARCIHSRVPLLVAFGEFARRRGATNIADLVAHVDAFVAERYRTGDWNALHRDLYGDLVFPLQVVIGLDERGTDYTGGEFLFVEQRPRAQSRGISTMLRQDHALVFTTRDRPLEARRGWSATPVRHGVSPLRSGTRHTLGLVFHDAATGRLLDRAGRSRV